MFSCFFLHQIVDFSSWLMSQKAEVKELVEKGVDIDAEDAYGWTAVRYAVRAKLEAPEYF